MEEFKSAPSTGTINRNTVEVQDFDKEEPTVLPVATGDTETSTLVQHAKLNTVTSRLNAGEHVTSIEQSLINDFGMDRNDARETLLDGLQPAITSALETVDEDNLKIALVEEFGYPEDLVKDMFSAPDETFGRYKPPLLNDVTEGNKVNEEDLSNLASKARNVHEMQMPMIRGAVAWITNDKAGKRKFKRDQADLNYAIANTLRKMGQEVTVDDKGELVGPEGQPIDEGFLQSVANSEMELIGGISGSMLAYKAANTLTQAPGFGKFGKLAKWGLKAASTFGGGTIGATAGRTLDMLHNAVKVKEELEAKEVIAKMKDAGAFAATVEAIGMPVGYIGTGLYRGLGKAWDLLAEGNKKGAYRSLKDLMHLDDTQVDQIIHEWERATGEQASKNREKAALTIIPQTEAGGEAIIRPAASMNPKSSAAIARTISNRAKDLLDNTGRMTNDNVGTVMKDELGKYTQSVKDYYTGVKDIASSAMEGKPYTFDYDKLAIDPLMERINASLTNPAMRDRFALYMNKIRDLGHVVPGKAKTKTVTRKFARSGPKEEKIVVKPDVPKVSNKLRSFDDLLELRKTVNEFKSRMRKVVSKQDYEAVNSVLGSIDSEISKVAKSNPEMGANWSKAWKNANIEYSKYFKLKENVMYKALTRKGVDTKKVVRALANNITAIDGTFMQVIGKLPPRTRAQAEGAVLDYLTKKHTIGFESGLQATHFTNLAEELKHVGFTTPHVRELKRSINEMAKVFKNDVELSRATGQVASPHFQSYLTTDPIVRAKYEIASSMFNYIKRLLPGGKGDAVALVTNVAKLMENPANSKAMAKIMKELPLDHELQSKIRELAIQYAKFGEKEHYPKVPVYRTGVPGSMAKAKNGPLGKGFYWSTSKDSIKARSKVTGGKIIKENILPTRVATEQNIKDALGVKDFDMKLYKDDTSLQELLKDRGFEGLSIGEEVLMFK